MFSKRPKGATIQEERNSGIGGLLWMLFGAIVTIAVGVVAYKSPMFGFDDSSTDVQVIENTDEPKVKPKVNTDKDNDYQFYDILPEQKMKPIPEDASIPQKVEEDIANKTKRFKPDAVVTEKTQEQPTELRSSDKSQSNVGSDKTDSTGTVDGLANDSAQSISNSTTANAKPKPATGDSEMVIVYENSTYDGTPVKKTTTMQPKQAESAKETETAQVSESSSSTGKTKIKEETTKSTKQADVKSGSEVATATEKAVTSQAGTSTAQDKPKSKATVEYAKPSKSYVLQINSYDTAEEADKRRAQVLMAGVDAKVIRRANGGETVYQVVSGSMNTAETVIRAQQALQKNGIDSLIVEKRR